MSTRGNPTQGGRERTTGGPAHSTPTGGQAEQIARQERIIADMQTRLRAIEGEQRTYTTWLANPANRGDPKLYRASQAYLARLDDAHDDLARLITDRTAALHAMTGARTGIPAPRQSKPTSSAGARARAQAEIDRANRRDLAQREAQSKAATEAMLAAQKAARAAARTARGQTRNIPARDELGQWKSRSETPSEE